MPRTTRAGATALAGVAGAGRHPAATACGRAPGHGFSRHPARGRVGRRAMNARRPALDIAIAGGGMVGAACALALACRGFAVALLEAREPKTWQGNEPDDLRVIALAPSSARLLDGLDVWRSVEAARVSPYRRM